MRSRALAATLLIGLTLYAWLSTFVPLSTIDPDGARLWDAAHPRLAVVVRALGLHDAFSSPIFLIAAAFVAASTAACAWERTALTFRYWAGSSSISDAQREELLVSPHIVVDIEAPAEERSTLVGLEPCLRRLGLRVHERDGALIASSGVTGLAGSALFHWAIVGLLVFAAAGQLTRYEGYANVVIGESFRDTREAYDAEFAAGPWFGDRFSGLEIALNEVDLDLVTDGVERGATPLVTASDAGVVLKRDWVYPNNPLRTGPLVVHRASVNPAFVGTIRTDEAAPAHSVVLYFDFARRDPQSFELPDQISDGAISVSVAPLGGEQVEIAVVGGISMEPETVGVGGQVQVAEGVNLTVENLTYFAQLHVVNDWSVPWIYAMFALLCVGSALTVFVPSRTVRMIAVEGEGCARLHVSLSRRRNDPAFPRRLEESLVQAVGSAGADGEGS